MPRTEDLRPMEELIKAANAYYENFPKDTKKKVDNFINSIDTNRDGKVSRSEFRRFIEQNGYEISDYVFNALHRNGRDYLKREEVIALYYIIKTRLNLCGGVGCGKPLLELYFTCVVCFDRDGKTYDLCCDCYLNKNFHHQHSSGAVFMDNHMLLIAKRNQARGRTNLNKAIAPASSSRELAIVPQANRQAPTRRLYRAIRAFQALEAVVGSIAGIAQLAAAAAAAPCTIM